MPLIAPAGRLSNLRFAAHRRGESPIGAVLKIPPRGYCHGVVEAIRAAKQTAKARPGEKIRMLGYLVHNTHVTDELQENGIELVDSDNRLEGLDQIDGGTVIFTAHGVSPAGEN